MKNQLNTVMADIIRPLLERVFRSLREGLSVTLNLHFV